VLLNVDDEPRNERVGLGRGDAGTQPKRLRGRVGRRDEPLAAVAPDDYQRRVRRRRGGAQPATQPIGRPGRQAERDDPSHRMSPSNSAHLPARHRISSMNHRARPTPGTSSGVEGRAVTRHRVFAASQ